MNESPNQYAGKHIHRVWLIYDHPPAKLCLDSPQNASSARRSCQHCSAGGGVFVRDALVRLLLV